MPSKALSSFLQIELGLAVPILFSPVGGGSINHTFKLEAGKSSFFCKINLTESIPGLFEKERNGLRFLESMNCFRVPKIYSCSEFEGQQILVLEWIEEGRKTSEFWKSFGESLAILHQQSWFGEDGKRNFGFYENNFMGALPQLNEVRRSWPDFFRECRLEPQLRLASEMKLLSSTELKKFEKLFHRLPEIFTDEPSSALHGDLWSGNLLCDQHSVPVLIDPATYYGHRTIDLGMLTLFGNVDRNFYEAYEHHYALPINHRQQSEISNLYPLLIHLNLFGGGYLHSIRSILSQLD